MRILVTGHHGYVGSVMAPYLAKRGYDVTGADSFLYEGCDLQPDRASIRARRCDVRDMESPDLVGFDAVVHLAALSNDPLGELNPALTFEINELATVALARSAREAGVRRFVFASSCSMYGAAETGVPVDEDAPLRPLTAYATSKARAEQSLAVLADADFAPVFMRNATAYGASPRLRLDIVINNLVGWALTTGRIQMQSDGTPWRPVVHVEDMAEAVAAVLEAPHDVVCAKAYNVGGDSENYQVRELAELVNEAVPECQIEFAQGSGPDPRSYRVDFGRFARTFPATRLRWTAAAGIRELVAAYRAAGLTRTVFESDRFIRLARLRSLRDAGRLDEDLRWRANTSPLEATR